MYSNGMRQAVKRPYHNTIDEIIRNKKMLPSARIGKGRLSDDYILGYEIALRTLANANGSFKQRLNSLYW